MKLDGIATFVVVAEAGSISEAARHLRLSKSVISDRLAELERSVGTVLLHRTTRKLTLTEDGAAFLDRLSGSFAKSRTPPSISPNAAGR
jgi:DNA-binding transcriptional LysR family regulator